MESIKILREQLEKLALQKQGKDQHQPRRYTGQTSASDFMRVIMALPVDSTGWTPLQDPLTGELFFNMGNSALGGSSPLGG